MALRTRKTRSQRGPRVLLFAIALALQAVSALALDKDKAVTQYVRQTWGLREGLPQLTVQGLARTPDGYLWLATEEGLVRFDGARFAVFDEESANGLRSRTIQVLTVGPDGTLWIGTLGGGIARMKDGVITAYGARGDLASDVVLSMVADSRGDLWVGTEGGGLAQLHAGAWRRYRTADGLPSDQVTELASASDGSVWIGTSAGLARIKDGALQRYDAPRGSVAALHQDRKGTIWVSVRGHGLHRVEGERLAPAAPPNGLGQATVLTVLDDRDGNLWLGTDAGLKRWSGDSLSTYGSKEGLSADGVVALLEDPEGGLWVGTIAGGLVLLTDGDFLTYSSQDGLPHDNVRSITQDARGDLWIGSRGGGLARLRESGPVRWSTPAGVPHAFVYSVLSTGDGSLWAGTFGAGLVRLREGRATVYTVAQGLPSNFVRALHEGKSGGLWIGCESGGLARMHAEGFRRYGVRDGLASDTVFSVLEDRNGDVWVGTNDGLSRLRAETFVTYRVNDGLASNQVRSLYEDSAGVLWVGTRSGLSRLQGGRFTSYGRTAGLGDAVFSILEDAGGYLWLSGNRGVWRVSRAELDGTGLPQGGPLRPRIFGVADGLKSRECNGGVQPAGWKSRDGRLWFATVQGVAVVDPARLRGTAAPSVPVLEGASADGQPFDPGRAFRAPPGRGQLEVSYTSPTFARPEGVDFRYRLIGFDQDWIDAGRRRVAYYTNLPPGRYSFSVKACALDGACSEARTSQPLELRPHFVQTRAFLASITLATGLLGWSAHRYRIRRLRAREQELETRVNEAVSRLKVLSGLLPICAWCKKIRDDSGYWNQIESYIGSHSEAEFTHGICPECAATAMKTRPRSS